MLMFFGWRASIRSVCMVGKLYVWPFWPCMQNDHRPPVDWKHGQGAVWRRVTQDYHEEQPLSPYNSSVFRQQQHMSQVVPASALVAQFINCVQFFAILLFLFFVL